MKVRISFSLNLTGTSYNAKNGEDLSRTLQNLGLWLSRLHLYNLSYKVESICDRTNDPLTKQYIRERNEENIHLSEQLFHDYKVEGSLDNGDTFTFTHSEPGYKENLTIISLTES